MTDENGYLNTLICLSSSSFQDPHGELTGQNVLIVRGSLEKTAEEFKMEASQTKELLAKCQETLYTERQKRPKPHRDDKILTAWNGKQFMCSYMYIV